MPSVISVENFRDGYVHVARHVLERGKPVAPRGIPTRELLDVIIEVEDPTDCLPVGVGRRLNLAICAAEAIQLIGGFSSPDLLNRITPNFKAYAEDDGMFHGAYGVRIEMQLIDVARKLTEDRDTRQAVITLWDPRLDNTPGKRDYPCTIALMFAIRENRLIMHTTMRSNDVYLGLAHDCFQFTQMQLTLCNVLRIEPGPYYHHAFSMHAYERDAEKIDALRTSTARHPAHGSAFWPSGFHGTTMAETIVNAQILAHGAGQPRTASAQWYFEQLAPYL